MIHSFPAAQCSVVEYLELLLRAQAKAPAQRIQSMLLILMLVVMTNYVCRWHQKKIASGTKWEKTCLQHGDAVVGTPQLGLVLL